MSSRLLLAASGLLLVLPRFARAEQPDPPPVGCWTLPEIRPTPGTLLPANIPAFWFRAPIYYDGGPDLASLGIEVREAGAATPVPIVFEKASAGDNLLVNTGSRFGEEYLIKPQRELRTGEVVLSFLDACGSYTRRPLISPPVRNEQHRYRVGPAGPLPTRTGTARLRELMFVEHSSCRDRRLYVDITLDPALAVFPLLAMEARSPGKRYLAGSFWAVPPGTVTAVLFASCGGTPPGDGYLPAGPSLVTFHASIGGGPAIAEPVTLNLNVDCAADAGVCEEDSPPDAAISVRDGAIAAREVAPPIDVSPDTSTPDTALGMGADGRDSPLRMGADGREPPLGMGADGREPVGIGAEGRDPAPGHGGGCHCAVSGGRASSAAPWLLLLALASMRGRARRPRG
jgi:hypothetical protein